jgi:hypothetical protein
MEGYGFLSACRERRVEAVVMRGISDMLDNKPQTGIPGAESVLGLDNAQYKATRHAAALFFATLDFVNPAAFSKSRGSTKKEITKVAMILDAEMHDISEIQAELFEVFKKYGIKNFSFRQSNSVYVEFHADSNAMCIYETLVKTGVVTEVAGHSFLELRIKSEKQPEPQLLALIDRINALQPVSIDDILLAVRTGNWIDEFPAYAKILIDTLKYYKLQKKRKKKTRRILYAPQVEADKETEPEKYFGPPATAKRVVIRSASKELAALSERVITKPSNELLNWFLGGNILDHDVPLHLLLSLSRRKLFYVWPSLGALCSASSMSVPAFVEACISEWETIRGSKGPSILKLLDQQQWDRLGKNQARDALNGRPLTLAKAVDLLVLESRLLLQNNLPPRGCILPSVYALSFNGVIAGDGVVERMLLTGMAGDLQAVADKISLPIRLVQSAVRGSLLPYQCAADVASLLDRTILSKTKLRCTLSLADPDFVAKHNREAADLSSNALAERYLTPRKVLTS